jgi:transcriptional regulator of heat shock response
MRPSLLFIIFLFFSQNILSAEIYRWKDEHGNTHFSQTPPKKQQTKKIVIKTSTIDSKAAKERLQKRLDGFQIRHDDNVLRRKEGQEGVDYKNQLDSYCSTIKSNLTALQSNKEVIVKGTNETMEDDKRNNKITLLQQDINERCK